jgi:protein SCO1/2
MMKNDTIVQFISLTVNPERDSFPALFDYAKRYGADMNRWWFLTGNKKDLYRYARQQLHVSAPEGNGGAEDFIHTEQFILLDRERYIRGYYNGLDSQEVGRCAFDIGRLNMEKKHRK